MSWNYRVIKEPEEDHFIYSIVEAYYDEAGLLNGYTDPLVGWELSLEDLRHTLERMLEACGRDIIEIDE